MKVGIDIDDVLFPWYDKAHQACVEAGITNGVEPSSWAPHNEYGCTLQRWLDVMEVETLSGRLYRGEPFPGVVDALNLLRDAGHTVHLITARGFFAHGWLIREHTARWLHDHAIPHDTLTFSKDKTIVRTDIFADDSEKNIAALVEAGIPCCLVDAPHNGHVQHPYRVAHISEFVNDIIHNIRIRP